MKSIVRAFDRSLVRAQGLQVYWDDPQAMFRIRRIPVPHLLSLADAQIPAGAPVLEAHFWNEHTPPFSAEGPDLAWGLSVYRMLVPSLRKMAQRITTDPDLADIQAVGGTTVLVSVGGQSSAEKLFARLGFEFFPARNSLGRLGVLFENIYTWALMWAYNGASLRHRHLLALNRTEVWMSRATFLRRHPPSPAP